MDANMEYIQNTQTLVGTHKRELLDTETGEKILVEQVTKRVYGSKQFWKIYMVDFLNVLGILDSKQIDVMIYIMDNTEAANNTYIGTYEKTAKGAKCAIETVRKVMKKLQEKGFIKKIQNGVYQVSPNIMMKGNDHKRNILLSYYQDMEV